MPACAFPAAEEGAVDGELAFTGRMEGTCLLTSDSAAMCLSPQEGTCGSTKRISAAGPASWLSERPLGTRAHGAVPVRHMPRLHPVWGCRRLLSHH